MSVTAVIPVIPVILQPEAVPAANQDFGRSTFVEPGPALESLSPAAQSLVATHLRHLARASAFREARASFNVSYADFGKILGLADRNTIRTLHHYEEEPLLGIVPKHQPEKVARLCQNLLQLAESPEVSELQSAILIKARTALIESIAREHYGSSAGVLRMLAYEHGPEALSRVSEGKYNQSSIKSAGDLGTLIPLNDLVKIIRTLKPGGRLNGAGYSELMADPQIQQAFRACQSELTVTKCWNPQLAELRLLFNVMGYGSTERELKQDSPAGLGLSGLAPSALSTGNLILWPSLRDQLNEAIAARSHPWTQHKDLVSRISELIPLIDADRAHDPSQILFSKLMLRADSSKVLSRAGMQFLLGVDEFSVRSVLRGHSTNVCSRAATAVLLAKTSGEAQQFVAQVRIARFLEQRRINSASPDPREIERDIWGLSKTDVTIHKPKPDPADSVQAVATALTEAAEIQKLGVNLKLRPALIKLAETIDGNTPAEITKGAVFVIGSIFATKAQCSVSEAVLARLLDGSEVADYERISHFLKIQGRTSDPVIRGIWQETALKTWEATGVPQLTLALKCLSEELYGNQTGFFRGMFGESHHPEVTWKLRLDKLTTEKSLDPAVMSELLGGLFKIPQTKTEWTPERSAIVGNFLSQLNRFDGNLDRALRSSLNELSRHPSYKVQLERLKILAPEALLAVAKLPEKKTFSTISLFHRKNDLVRAISTKGTATVPPYQPETLMLYQVLQCFPGVSLQDLTRAIKALPGAEQNDLAPAPPPAPQAENKLFFPITALEKPTIARDPVAALIEAGQYFRDVKPVLAEKLIKVKEPAVNPEEPAKPAAQVPSNPFNVTLNLCESRPTATTYEPLSLLRLSYTNPLKPFEQENPLTWGKLAKLVKERNIIFGVNALAALTEKSANSYVFSEKEVRHYLTALEKLNNPESPAFNTTEEATINLHRELRNLLAATAAQQNLRETLKECHTLWDKFRLQKQFVRATPTSLFALAGQQLIILGSLVKSR